LAVERRPWCTPLATLSFQMRASAQMCHGFASSTDQQLAMKELQE
jgi:hypothetical protein